MKITYIGPFAEVEIAATGALVKRGETVDVPKDVAGEPPSGQPGEETYSPGSGLLAQEVNWVKNKKEA